MYHNYTYLYTYGQLYMCIKKRDSRFVRIFFVIRMDLGFRTKGYG